MCPVRTLLSSKKFIVIDDDPSVIEIWKSSKSRLKMEDMKFLSNTYEFLDLKEDLKNSETLVICDFYLEGKSNAGAFIKEHCKQFQFVICTNAFDDEAVWNLANELKIPVVPKPIVPYMDLG